MRSLIHNYKFLIIIMIIGFSLRFFKLSEFPIHLSHDEITQLYDAISIAQTGKDIYGNFLPFIFPSIGDFKPPFYTYATSLMYLLFGSDEIIIRLTGAIFSLLLIPAVYFFTLKLLKNKTIGLFASLFTSIAPFEIFFGRKSFESGAGIFFILIGFTLMFRYFESKKGKWLYLSSVVFSGGMYTYFSHAIIIPLLIACFIVIFRRNFKGKLIQNLRPLALLIFLISPMIFMILSNPAIRYRSQTVFVGQDRSLGALLETGRTNNPLTNFLMQKNITYSYIFDRYLKQFDPVFLFANGLDLTNQGLLDSGPLLLIQLPFLLLGITFIVKKKDLTEEKKFILAWILLGMLPSALTFENYSPHRIVMVFTMFNILCAIGIYYSLELFTKHKEIINAYKIFILFIFLVNMLYFLHIYFVNYAYEKSEKLQYPFKQIAQFVWSEYQNFDSIVFDPQFGDIAPMIGVGGNYYLGYYGNYPPEKFQKEFHKGTNPREVIFDKFSIRQVYWPADKDKKKTLFIVSVWSVPLKDVDQNQIIKRFNFYNGKLAFYAIKL